MTLNSSDSKWLKPALILAGMLGLLTLWAYLGGGIFMLANEYRFLDATPLTMYQYWVHYGDNRAVKLWLFGSAALALVVTGAPLALLLKPAKRSLFGDARWARPAEIRKAGLLGSKGIILGRHLGSYLMFGGSEHVILSAPTRSGKGVGIVIPNLLSWSDSAVVLDIKQENHAITSGYRRKHGQPCYLFNPAAADYRTHRYNPLAYISEDPNFRIDDVQKIANMLFPDVPNVDPIWTATPRSLFLGITLYLLETPGKPVTLGQVLRESLADGDGAEYFGGIIAARSLGERIRQAGEEEARQQARRDIDAILGDPGRAPEEHPKLAEMAVWAELRGEYRAAARAHLDELRRSNSRAPDLLALADAMPVDTSAQRIGKALSGACVRALNSYISIAAETTRAGIMTGFRSRLELWYNPIVDAATSANDFDLRDVRKKRMTIYLGITPDNLDRLSPLINLFFQQLIDLNTRELPEHNAALKYQCLILADEFVAIGKMPVLAKGIGYIAGYGLRMMPILQNPAQLVDIYGEHAAATFTVNHAVQVVFPPKRTETKTASDISEWLGYQTVEGVSTSEGKGMFAKREKSQSTSEQKRALLLPQEITALGKTEEIVVVEGIAPILAKKIRYYEDGTFVDMLKSVSPSLAALGRKLPTRDQLEDAIKRGELAAPVRMIDLDAHQQAVGAQEQVTAAPAARTQTTTVKRAVTVQDLGRLDALSLSDFAVDFSGIEAPGTGELDEAALLAYADSLCRKAGIPV